MEQLTSLFPFLLMFVIFYLFLIRPQQKKAKIRNQMLNSLAKNDKIVTVGGLHGTIESISDDVVVLKVNDGCKLTFDRSAISSVKEKAANQA